MLHQALRLAGISSGDIIFFLRDTYKTDFERAVLSSGGDHDVFHVGIFCNDDYSIVHTLPKSGTQVQSLYNAIAEIGPDQLEVHSVQLESEVKSKAGEWAAQRVGTDYNDIFSPNSLSSNGREAYYCCQLVVKAYHNVGVDDIHPEHKLRFCDSQGRTLPYWINYFKARGLQIPEGEPGSHPSKLYQSKLIKRRLIKSFRMQRFVIPKVFDASLHFIGGARVALNSNQRFSIVEPRSGAVITECCSPTPIQVNEVIESVSKVQPLWASTSAQERGAILRKAARLIREHSEEIAMWESRDNGKPIGESFCDITSSADSLEFFGGTAHNLVGNHFPLGNDQYAYTVREPWGIVGAIGVWNYPFQTAVWKIAPALMCGNAVVYKPSPLAPLTSVILALILKHVGLPDGVLTVLQGEAETGKLICEHKSVNKVTFTGSSRTGLSVLNSCCSCDYLKPATLELGGKGSLIIFPDADIDRAVTGALMANYFCQGAVCTNASKVLVHSSIMNKFRDLVVERTKAIKVGDPLDKETKMGALISMEHLARVKEFIKDAIEMGARKLCGGEEVPVKNLAGGYYISPCILDNVKKTMRVYSEEIFGPVMLLIPFSDTEEAISIANDTQYGLANGLFTNDLSLANSVSSRLQSGTVYVNTYNDINVMVPFGGTKQSGFGRENGLAALETFSQVKSVFVNASNHLHNPF